MPITITATGNLLNIADGAETAQVTCTLIGYGQSVPRIIGTGIIVNPVQSLVPAATSFSFTIISPNHIVPNAVPNQLFHTFNFYNHRGQLTSSGTYDLSGISDGGSVDISTLTPIINTGTPAPPNAVLLNPTGPQFITGFGLGAPYLTINNGGSIRSGVGSPNGVVGGNPGDLYLNTNGGASTTLWVKESGASTNTGWVGK